MSSTVNIKKAAMLPLQTNNMSHLCLTTTIHEPKRDTLGNEWENNTNIDAYKAISFFSIFFS